MAPLDLSKVRLVIFVCLDMMSVGLVLLRAVEQAVVDAVMLGVFYCSGSLSCVGSIRTSRFEAPLVEVWV